MFPLSTPSSSLAVPMGCPFAWSVRMVVSSPTHLAVIVFVPSVRAPVGFMPPISEIGFRRGI